MKTFIIASSFLSMIASASANGMRSADTTLPSPVQKMEEMSEESRPVKRTEKKMVQEPEMTDHDSHMHEAEEMDSQMGKRKKKMKR